MKKWTKRWNCMDFWCSFSYGLTLHICHCKQYIRSSRKRQTIYFYKLSISLHHNAVANRFKYERKIKGLLFLHDLFFFRVHVHFNLFDWLLFWANNTLLHNILTSQDLIKIHRFQKEIFIILRSEIWQFKLRFKDCWNLLAN